MQSGLAGLSWKAKIGFILICLLLLAASGIGSVGAISDLQNMTTPAQILTPVFVLLYSILGVLAVIHLWIRSRWGFALCAAWTIACAGAAFSGTLLYGDAGWKIAVFSGLSVYLIGAPMLVFVHSLQTKSK